MAEYEILNAATNTMRYTKGVYYGRAMGLAATQIGYHKRFIVFGDPDNTDPYSNITIALNPCIIETDLDFNHLWEGCLSSPW